MVKLLHHLVLVNLLKRLCCFGIYIGTTLQNAFVSSLFLLPIGGTRLFCSRVVLTNRTEESVSDWTVLARPYFYLITFSGFTQIGNV